MTGREYHFEHGTVHAPDSQRVTGVETVCHHQLSAESTPIWMARLIKMALRTVRVMCRLFVISTVVMFGSFTVVSSRVLVMFCRLPVMISRLL